MEGGGGRRTEEEEEEEEREGGICSGLILMPAARSRSPRRGHGWQKKKTGEEIWGDDEKNTEEFWGEEEILDTEEIWDTSEKWGKEIWDTLWDTSEKWGEEMSYLTMSTPSPADSMPRTPDGSQVVVSRTPPTKPLI